ncbi:MAG: PLP-dependent transferase [Lachnospiraceae bacterium]|nr:PLP-dependent transferase [Lachnospiraceae bacterium]
MIEENYYAEFDRKENLAFDSKVVHGALGCDPISGAVSFPIFQSATFRHRDFGISTGYNYSRLQNPTRQELERTMAILEEGVEGYAFTSGQAANMAVFNYLKRGDHCLLCDDLYGGTHRIVEDIFKVSGIEISYVDMGNLDDVEKAIKPNTKMVFLETPTNPMMKVGDIKGIAAISHKHNALFVVDNTFMTPYFQRPLTLGADIVVHSGTKYLCGHNDVVAGIVVIKDENLKHHFEIQLKSLGAGLGPMDSWLVIRGIKTLSLRMKKHNENAKIVAEWLRNHPKVKKVYYVGFEDHPGYALNLSQASGFGGMISFELDSEESAHKILSKVNMILFAESLGGTETLVTYPITQTHEDVPDDVRRALGINEAFIRISIGIEDPNDIIADLEQALA